MRAKLIILFLLLLGSASAWYFLHKRPRLKKEEKLVQQPDSLVSANQSTINFPLVLSIQAIESKLNAELPQKLYHDTLKEVVDIVLTVYRFEEIALGSKEGRLSLKLPTYAQFEVMGLFGKKEISKVRFALDIRLSSELHIDSNWQVISDFKLDQMDWRKEPVLMVGPVKLNFRNRIEELIKAESAKVLNEINQGVKGQIDIRKTIEPIWEQLHKPTLLNREVQEIWMKPSLNSVFMSEISVEDRFIIANCRLNFQAIVASENNFDTTIVPLPSLRTLNDTNRLCELDLIYQMREEQLNDLLNREMIGYEFEVEENQVIIQKIELQSHYNLLRISVELGGDLEGVYLLEGKPKLDRELSTLAFDSLDFEIKEADPVLLATDFFVHEQIQQALIDGLKLNFEGFTQFDGQLLESSVEKGKMAEKLNLSASDIVVRPQEIYIKSSHIMVHLKVHFRMNLEIMSL